MKPTMKTILTGMLCAIALLVSTGLAAASTLTFDVLVNTAPLIGSSSGPFSLDFQLNGGTTFPNPNANSASITNFQFFGGSAAGGPTLIGGANGSLTAGVTLNNAANPFNEFFQAFIPGSSLRFTVSVTTNLATPTPDIFAFAILDKDLFNIPTTSAFGDSLIQFNIKPNPAAADLQGFRGTDASGFGALTAGPCPNRRRSRFSVWVSSASASSCAAVHAGLSRAPRFFHAIRPSDRSSTL